MIRKLRIKFICMTMALVTIVLVFMLGMQYRSTRESMERESLEVLRSAVTAPMDMNRPGDFTQPCFVLIETLQGNLLVSSNLYYDLSDLTLLREIYRQASAAGESTGVLSDFNLRFLRSDALYAFTDITAEIQILNTLLRNCVLFGAAGFFSFLLITVLLSRWIVRPVEQAWQQQRQFVADASHELKTPLTVILTNAELLQEGGDARCVSNILTMSHQMRGLVESLLQLARADCGRTKAELASLDYSKLVEDALLPFEPLYFEQGLALESEIAPDITLTGSESHLRQVVEILLDNGQKYSDPGGTIRLRLQRQGRNQCLLRVSTPGRELTDSECRDIFKRFYRVDKARSMNHSYGLGLAIAQRITEDHKGRIWAESGSGENTFCVQLPLT